MNDNYPPMDIYSWNHAPFNEPLDTEYDLSALEGDFGEFVYNDISGVWEYKEIDIEATSGLLEEEQ
jgi:hypothetical protein